MILHHTRSGAGPAVLLLHSTATDSRQWNAQLAALSSSGWTVIAPDLRGFGRTPLTSEPFSDARDVLDLLDHLGIGSCAVVGSSGGGAVALQVASCAPDRVNALVLLCTAAEGVEPSEEFRAFAQQEQAFVQAGDVDAATELNVATWLQPGVDGATRQLFREMQATAFGMQLAAGEDVHEDKVEVDLSRITCPTTLVSGAHDFDHFRAVADHLAAGLPHATRVHLSWAGHFPNLERPAETTELIARSISP